MLALENPHCGISGVPFINSTTGLESTALSIAALVSVERRRVWNSVKGMSWHLGIVAAIGRIGRDARRKACNIVSN